MKKRLSIGQIERIFLKNGGIRRLFALGIPTFYLAEPIDFRPPVTGSTVQNQSSFLKKAIVGWAEYRKNTPAIIAQDKSGADKSPHIYSSTPRALPVLHGPTKTSLIPFDSLSFNCKSDSVSAAMP